MQRISIKAAKPGMVLAEPVLSPNGLTLAGPGVTLTEAVILRIMNAGTRSVVVEGRAGEGSGKELQRAQSSLEYTFRRHRSNIFMMTLRNVLFDYLDRRITEEERLVRERRAALEAAREARRSAKETGGAADSTELEREGAGGTL